MFRHDEDGSWSIHVRHEGLTFMTAGDSAYDALRNAGEAYPQIAARLATPEPTEDGQP